MEFQEKSFWDLLNFVYHQLIDETLFSWQCCEHNYLTIDLFNSRGLMAIATQKELQELDVSLLLNPNTWQDGMNDEADFDVLSLNE